MFANCSQCRTVKDAVSPVVLNFSSEIMRFYPWFLRVSIVLQRLVQ